MADQLFSQQSQEKSHISKTVKSDSSHYFRVPNAAISKKIYFYKSGDPTFSAIRVAINSRTFKTFDSLLDDLSNKIPLPFGVRTITTPHGSNSVKSLSDLKDGQSYICSDRRKVKPINLEVANRKQHPWFVRKSFNPEQPAIQPSGTKAYRRLYWDSPQSNGVPKKLVIFRNGDPIFRRNLILNKQTMQSFRVLLKYIADLMHFPVLKLYSIDGREIEALYQLKYIYDYVVAAGQEAYKPRKYSISTLFLPNKLPAISNHSYPNFDNRTDHKNTKVKAVRRQWMINSACPSSSEPQAYSASTDKIIMDDTKSSFQTTFSVNNSEPSCYKNCIYAKEDNLVKPLEDDFEKSIYVNKDGSVTVEMKIHFQIKEEELIEWTTTISHPGVCDKNCNDCNLKLESNVETGEFINEQNHHKSKQMQLEELVTEQEFDDPRAQPKFTMDTEMDKERHYDIWQNNFSSTNENLIESGVEISLNQGCPGHKLVKQGEVSQESIITKFDTQNIGNIIQFPNKDAGLEEFVMEHYNEHFSISNEKKSYKIISDASSDSLHTREEINVNAQRKEKTMQDKNTSFVRKDNSSKSLQQYFEDQVDAPEIINSISKSTNATNVFSEYNGENGCVDSNINFAKPYLRPSSGDPTYSVSKQRTKDRRPMSASFQYSKASMSIHHDESTLSSGEIDSLTSIKKKKRIETNSRCANTSEFSEIRKSIFLADCVSMCPQCQNCTKIQNEFQILASTKANDSSLTTEGIFCKTEDTCLTYTYLNFPSDTNKQHSKKESSENTDLYLEHEGYSQPPELLWRSENNEELRDNCTIRNGGEVLTEIDDSEKYDSAEYNSTEIFDESKGGFHIGSGGDGIISHCLSDLKSPNEKTNSNFSQLPVACSADKKSTSSELLENRRQRMENQHLIVICSSCVTSSMPEKVSEVSICQDIFSESKETSLMIACGPQLSQRCKDDDQGSTITTEDNFSLSGSSTPVIECDSESSSVGNRKQIADINCSSNENIDQQCSSKTIRKKWKHLAKKNNKILNIATVENGFREDSRSMVLSPLLQKNQELHDMHLSSSQSVEQNLLRSMTPTSDLMHSDRNLGPYPPTSLADERGDNCLINNILKEENNMPDKNSDIIYQSGGNIAEANILTECKLEQSSDKIACNLKRLPEVPDDSSHAYLLQNQPDVAEGEIKCAPTSGEIWCQPVTELTKMVRNMSELERETNEVAVQVDIGIVSEIADERNSIEDQDITQMLCKLQSMVDTFKNMSHHRQKTHLENSSGMSDVLEHLATTLNISSKILLAWLAVINLNVSPPPATEAALLNNCSCSEVLTFLELIRHVVKFQVTNDSKQNISQLHKCASHFAKMWASEHNEELNYVRYNDPKVESPVPTETSVNKQTVLFGFPQLTGCVANENYLDMQNLIKQLDPNETQREVKINFSTHSNEEGRTKEVGSKEAGLLNFENNLASVDILEEQVMSDSVNQNECTIENTEGITKEWSEMKAEVLEQNEHHKTRAIIEQEEFIDNTMESSGHPACLGRTEAYDQFADYYPTAKSGEFLAVSDITCPQTKIFPQKFMGHESLLSADKCGPSYENDICQEEHMRGNHNNEIHVSKLPSSVSVFSKVDFEDDNKTESKQQLNKIFGNSFTEGKADRMKLPSCIGKCAPSNHDVKQSLQRQQTHDLSEGDQASVNSIASDYNSQASNEITTEGEEDNFVKTKHFSANFVRKATERHYGKSHIAPKLHSHNQSPLCNNKSMAGITHNVKNGPLNISGLEKGQILQKYQNSNSHSEEGVLIDKGRWLLKENHLIRKSPPLNLGMYGNLDTTSVDTTFDNSSDDTLYPRVNPVHSRPLLSELSSSEVEEMIKSAAMCSYFSMPHASDSEPFVDQSSLKSEPNYACSGSHLIQKNKSGKQTAGTSVQLTNLRIKDDHTDSPFASMGLHIFDNKVSPLTQPLPGRAVVEQAPGEAANVNRTLQNTDSFDKLHLLCGQHCPILTAVIESSNEESRRFVYQKKSDPENQWIPYLENEEHSHSLLKYIGLMLESRTCTGINKKSIDSIISDICSWFKTSNIDNDVNRIKSSLDTKYLGVNKKILKPYLHTNNTGFKYKDNLFISNVDTEAEKKYVKNIVKQLTLKQEVQNNIKAIKERINSLLVQAPKMNNPLSVQIDPYHLNTRMAVVSNNITVPSMENEIIGVTLPSENISGIDEKELFCDSRKPMHGQHNK